MTDQPNTPRVTADVSPADEDGLCGVTIYVDGEPQGRHTIRFDHAHQWAAQEVECVEEALTLEAARTIGGAALRALTPDVLAPVQPRDYAADAETLGLEHGANAASWWLQDAIGGRAPGGAADLRTAEHVIRGLEEGDPEVLDALPAADLSGQWADGMTPRRLMLELGLDDDAYPDPELESELCDRYCDAFATAARDAIEAACLEHVREEAAPSIWQMLETRLEGPLEAIQDLYSWSLNYDPGKGPMTLFLDLIGYSDEEFGEPLYSMADASLGYVELDKLGLALRAYADDPHGARDYVGALLEAEGRE